MFGHDSGVINSTQEGLEQAFSLSALGSGVNVGAILIGCAIGAFLAGRLTDVIGRRNVMSLVAATFILSAMAPAPSRVRRSSSLLASTCRKHHCRPVQTCKKVKLQSTFESSRGVKNTIVPITVRGF